jgi:hypothetical protein
MSISRIYANGHTLNSVMRHSVSHKIKNVREQPDLRSCDATRCIHNLHPPTSNFKWTFLMKIRRCLPQRMGRLHRSADPGSGATDSGGTTVSGITTNHDRQEWMPILST